MPVISIRAAEKRDALEVGAVNVASWRAAFSGQIDEVFLASLSASRQAERFSLNIAERAGVEMWVAENSAGICGYATIGPDRSPDASPLCLELYALYLRPDVWRQGVGRCLHAHLLERFALRESRRAVLWVLECNARARAFYEALGWQQTAERRQIELGGNGYATVQYERRVSCER